MKPYFDRILAVALCLSVCAQAACGHDLGVATITMIDGGPATVIHVASKLSAREGGSINNEDIVETSATTSLLRLEFDDSVWLDLGPSSRVMVRPGPIIKDAPLAYVLQGWVKVSVGKPMAGVVVLTSSPLDVTAVSRDLVLHVKEDDSQLFAESGDVQVRTLDKHGKAALTQLGRGGFMVRRQDGDLDVLPRPVQSFVESVPRAFMDTLPSRWVLFKGKDVRLDSAGRLSYDDTQDWLNAPPRIRTRFLSRWKPLLQDEAFRGAVTSQLSLHPEWQSILYPHKPHAHEAAKP